MDHDVTHNREARAKTFYERFCAHYQRLYGATLPIWDYLGSSSQEVYKAAVEEHEAALRREWASEIDPKID